MGRKVNLVRTVRLLLEVSVLTILAAWGTYATITMSFNPTPSIPDGIASQVLQQVSVSHVVNASGITIPPNSTTYFGMDFRDKTGFNTSQTFPLIHPFPGHPGVIWGEFLASDPESTVSSFVKHYAVFTYWATYSGGFVTVLSGPGASNPMNPTTFPIYTVSSIVYSNGAGSTETDTGIMEADGAGNYTLYIVTAGRGNSTAHVTMGYSSVTFAPSRPYFYFGVTSLAVLAGYVMLRVGTSSRRPKQGPPPETRLVPRPPPEGVPRD